MSGDSPKVTLAQVRASFNRNIAEPWPLARVFRPLADLLTPLACNLGLSGNAVTGMRAAVALAALPLLAAGQPALWPLAALCAYLGYVLDCVDGNVVRVSDTASYWGKFIDGLADGVFVYLAPFAAGLGAWLAGHGVAFLVVGALTTVLALFAQMTRTRLSFFREWMVGQSGAVDLAAAARPARLEARALALLVGASMATPLALLLPDGAAAYVLLAALTQMPADATVIATSLWQGSIMLRRWRRSIHASAG